MRLHTSTVPALTIGLILLVAQAWAGQAQLLSDPDIRVQIEQRLAGRDFSDVTVRVNRGTVSLTGTVLTVWAKARAYQEARRIAGVRFVRSSVSVRREGSDEAVALEVQRRILDYAFYTIYDNIEVDVQDGRVTLTGHVIADAKSQAIVEVAARVTGVVEVHNMVRQLVASPLDENIRDEIAGLIYTHPVFRDYPVELPAPIHIIVERRRVTLIGVTRSALELEIAERIARLVAGVVSVETRLNRHGWTS